MTKGSRILPIREDWEVIGRVDADGKPSVWGEYAATATRYRAILPSFAPDDFYFEEVQVRDRPGIPFYAQVRGSQIATPGVELNQVCVIEDIPRLRNYFAAEA